MHLRCALQHCGLTLPTTRTDSENYARTSSSSISTVGRTFVRIPTIGQQILCVLRNPVVAVRTEEQGRLAGKDGKNARG